MLLEAIYTTSPPTCLRVFRTSFSQLPMQLYELPVRHFAFYRHAFFQVFDTVSAHWHELPCISPVHVLATTQSVFLFCLIIYLCYWCALRFSTCYYGYYYTKKYLIILRILIFDFF